MFIDLSGNWSVEVKGEIYPVVIPGTLDENHIGDKDNILVKKEGREFVKVDGPIATRFTRKYSYMGPAFYRKTISSEDIKGMKEDSRAFLIVERSRALELFVDGKMIPSTRGSLSTPYYFEVTGLLNEGSTIEFVCDNSYKELPMANIIYSSAATDETQTNWNGLLGKVGIEVVPRSFISAFHIYTHGHKAYAKVTGSAYKGFNGMVSIRSKTFEKEYVQSFSIDSENDSYCVELEDMALSCNALLWDEYEGNLEECLVTLCDDKNNELHSITECFGIRDFSYDKEGRLTINQRRFFLRGEANCALFPEEGHWPMDEKSWEDIMEKYKSYGINCVRFHSHCPPKAAFLAADKLGIMVQPELSHWNPVDAFLPEHSYEYYEKELREILDEYSNHPSFVMLSLGNELKSDDEGVRRMEKLLDITKEKDSTRLYTWGSNNFYGEKGCNQKSDFYTSSNFLTEMLRGTSAGMTGHINEEYPGSCHDYSAVMSKLRETYDKPVFGFEVGQFEMLPDFDELQDFKGVTRPDNFEIIKNRAKERGMLPDWKKYVEATGELALLCYREEVEAVLRTKEMSGLSLLGIQDFSGQGTALVGMMNSHLEKKPFDFSDPCRFRSFFTQSLPLVLLKKYTYTYEEAIEFQVLVANYSKDELTGGFEIKLIEHGSQRVAASRNLGEDKVFTKGSLESAGKTSFMLKDVFADSDTARRLDIVVLSKTKEDVKNTYPVWIYPDLVPICPSDIYETETLDDKAKKLLEEGGTVFLAPPSDKEHIPNSIKGQFSTDFWSVGTFDFQEGGMGQYIDKEHPVFRNFPTESYTQWQWWPMANQRAVILNKDIKPIIIEMDSYSYLRKMAQLFEGRCKNGRVMVSTLGLKELQNYPEARALLRCIYDYVKCDDFCPEQEFSIADLEALFD